MYYTYSFKYHYIKYRNLQNCFLIQFNYKKIKTPFFPPLFVPLFETLDFRSGRRLSYISLSLRKSRPFIFACESRRCIGYPDSESPSLLYLLPLLLFHFLFLHSSFLASEPGASDQMEFFHFIFPALCTISNSIVPALIPAHFRAVFHVHTRTFVFHLAIR